MSEFVKRVFRQNIRKFAIQIFVFLSVVPSQTYLRRISIVRQYHSLLKNNTQTQRIPYS